MATKRTDSTEGGREMDGGAENGAPKEGSARKSSAAKKMGRAAKKATAVKSGTTAGESAEPRAAAKQTRATRGGAPATGRAKQAASRAKEPDLRSEARNFASARPEGWSHDEWLGFLEGLRERGHNIEDKEAIGTILERERLGIVLEKVPGVGGQRVRAIAERYGNIWRLKDASPDELAREANIPRPLAERITQAVR